MFDWLAKGAAKFLQAGAEYFQTQAFLQTLASVPQPQALAMLQAHVTSLDAKAYKRFVGYVWSMLASEQQTLQSGQGANDPNSWGSSVEDHIAYYQAHIQAGPQPNYGAQQAAARIQGLQLVLQFSQQFRSQMAQPDAPAAATSAAAAGGSEFSQLFGVLQSQYEKEVRSDNIAPERKAMLDSVMRELGDIVNAPKGSLEDQMASVARVRALMGRMTEAAQTPSRGDKKGPPPGTRAAWIGDLHRELSALVLGEAARPKGGDKEWQAMQDLHLRCVDAKNRIFDLPDDGRAVMFERESLRPLALDVRTFALRNHLAFIDPLWPSPPLSVSPNRVFYSGGPFVRELVAEICASHQLELARDVADKDAAQARWDALRSSHIAVMDFTGYRPRLAAKDLEAAVAVGAVGYDLGIALVLGKQVVVISERDAPTPFDVETEPVELVRGEDNRPRIGEALDRAMYGLQRSGADSSTAATINEAHRRFLSHPNGLVGQTLKMLDANLSRDPVQARAVIDQLLGFAGPGGPQLALTAWSPSYPDPAAPRLFHVMPFGEPWSEQMMAIARGTCQRAGIEYVRGDQPIDAHILRSIWEEISRAKHVLVDLTGFNPNVTLELGIAHALGRKTLILGRAGTEKRLFPSIAKLRVVPYSLGDRSGATAVERFVA
ncbi:MAG TPA: hypothetical protein VEK05_13425 [Burkholderiales bacterium]|nr:hypothetical protein [Burkholderiales bacterium]